MLISILEGNPPGPFWAKHARLKTEYEQARAALESSGG